MRSGRKVLQEWYAPPFAQNLKIRTDVKGNRLKRLITNSSMLHTPSQPTSAPRFPVRSTARTSLNVGSLRFRTHPLLSTQMNVITVDIERNDLTSPFDPKKPVHN